MNIKINTGRRPGRLPKPMILLITVLFFAVGILLIVRTVHSSTHLTAETTAVITDVKIEESVRHDSNKNKALIEVNSKEEKIDRVYYPVAEYTVDGQTYSSEGTVGSSNPNEYKVGDSLKIKYDPANPSEADLTGGSAKGGIIPAIACIIAGLIGGFIFLKS